MAAFLRCMKMCKDRREDKRIIGEAVLHKMGRGKFYGFKFHTTVSFFNICIPLTPSV